MISGPIPSPGSVTMRWLIVSSSGSRSFGPRHVTRRRRSDSLTAPSSASGPSRCSCSARSNSAISAACSSVIAMSSSPLSRRWRISWSISKATSRPAKRTSCSSRSTSPAPACASARQSSSESTTGKQPDLRAVGVEDVGEARRDDRLEAVVLQAPGRVLARGAAAEVLAGDEDRVGRQIPARLLGPVVEQELAEAGALDALEELLGHDLVGVDVGAVEVADGRERLSDPLYASIRGITTRSFARSD